MSITIKTSPIPDTRKKWLIKIEVSEPVVIKIHIIPDKLIADHASLKKYVQETIKNNTSRPEDIILSIIENINNELVPKWLEVYYENDGVSVKIEDQQPGLDNFKPTSR